MVVSLMSRFSRRSSVHLREKTLAGRGPSTHEATEMKSPFKRALAIQEQALGPNHPDVALTLNNLAIVYKDEGKLDKVRNFIGYGKYRPASLRNHSTAKAYFTDVMQSPIQP
jgi:hypothetical protein